ncbi:translesion error-prone DNA polymerase V autoproteolytic subunit [Ktedonosporobacter rubrisoli]|uniref:Translesion error-prone DNA polymerase V autoproteolytic subunit n=1 Tax=Ktedonosporobacter rubrisoli TaxID=2509675 RepID=A0A4V0YYB5_KTERU|nr:translesion error-prone DNA polymerase V autoproteolytic subunit [Ktedonosporobacter rubrisoli]QBD75641.1 translesion error-prone DNA polymerase V autoproteolytic subunit [Ktedonosporobacter rubrisoli]
MSNVSVFFPAAAGFPSPASGWEERRLDLGDLLVSDPEATFFVRVQGHSMQEAGIHDGDLLVVNRALEPVHRSIIVAVLHGTLMVKRLLIEGERRLLKAEHPRYPPFVLKENTDFAIWGVVTAIIHPLVPSPLVQTLRRSSFHRP